ncbi:MAG: hypothetical protein AB8I08_39945 [Sandaracinaceae bacterium]
MTMLDGFLGGHWKSGLLAAATIGACIAMSGTAHAQTVTVQGQVQVGGQGYGQPPAGYGQASGTVYVQPQYPQQQAQPQPYYQPQYQAPQRQVRYEERTSSIPGLWIPGIIMFGVSYGLGGLSGLLSNGDYSDWMWVPVIGPWVALTYSDFEDEVVGAIVGGVVQAAGLGMFILGIALQRTYRVAVYALDEGDPESPELAFDLLPAPGGGQLGLSLTHF